MLHLHIEKFIMTTRKSHGDEMRQITLTIKGVHNTARIVCASIALTMALWCPKQCLAQPSVGVDPNGIAYIATMGQPAALGQHSSLVVYSAAPGDQYWSSTTVPGAEIDSEPAIAVRLTGEVDIVAQGTNNSLWYYSKPDGQSFWKSQQIDNGHKVISAPAIAVRQTGEVDVVAVDANYRLAYFCYCGAQPFWQLPYLIRDPQGNDPQVFGNPAIAVRSVAQPGEVDVVVTGVDKSLNYYWATPGSSWNWSQIGKPGSTFSDPAIAVRQTGYAPVIGEADVVAQGPNNSLMYYHAKPAEDWSAVQIQEAGAEFTPAIAVRPNGEGDIVVSINHSLVYYFAFPQDASWRSTKLPDTSNPWQYPQSPPAIVVRTTGEADVVAIGNDNSLLYYWAFPGKQWFLYTVAPAGTTY
jgi:hypothetical protein